MILRRVISHVKEQNWTAIVLDFLIVVLGVFIGIQLGNWNEARLNRRLADEYHQRLLADMRLEALNYEWLQYYYRDVQAAAETTYKALSGEIELDDAALLVSAYRASQYNWFERYRATFDELVASGKLDLIEDAQLRTQVTGYYNMGLLEEIRHESQDSEYRRAYRRAVPPDLQEGLGEQCGDQQIEGAPVGALEIGYPCMFEWPPERMEAGAAIFRSDASWLPLLRLQIANLSARNFGLELNRTVFGLDTFMQTVDED
ncbi:MAG: hypothetical protein R3284_06515 [Rubricoccaceae bacterium]|nr:hypothetical protein [Rubricoccaceae bacterium]